MSDTADSARSGFARRGCFVRGLAAALVLLPLFGAWLAYDLCAPRRTSLRRFDPDEVARLETAMWRSYYGRRRLGLFLELAELQAEIFRAAAESFEEHARLRAEAMLIRDEKAKAGGVNGEDWRRIDELLHASWRSLRRAVGD